MSAIRQDAWSQDDDLILAEVTLRHIREGSTQLNAFEEVGDRIGRTPAACGFRWNSCVRKKYEAAIQLAKTQRQKRNQMKKNTAESAGIAMLASAGSDEAMILKSESITGDALSMDAVIRFLRNFKHSYQETSRQLKQLDKELREKTEELTRLRADNDKLLREVNNVQTDYRVVNDDYKALIQIMDRARKLALLVEDDEESRPKFKMDANGNLERIE